MSKTLTRVDIVESIHNQIGLPKKTCTEMVEILLDMMKATLASGEDVMITGFGKFSVNHELHTVAWPNGADIAPEFLYEKLQVLT